MTKNAWSGCENWWAGYPFIVFVELRDGDETNQGYLTLNAEVGPVANHKSRKSIIEAIRMAAFTNGLERIQFPANATEKGRLYSRFLQKSSIAITDIRNADEIERKFVELVGTFEPEFELVADIIPEFLRLNEAP